MSLGMRGFVEFLIDRLHDEGICGDGYSEKERMDDVVETIWDAYEEWKEG